MEVKEFRNEIFKWKRDNKGKSPTVVAINPATFHELMLDKDAINHIELYEVDGRIIGNKFDGIPLFKTDKVEKIRMISEEDGNVSL